MGKLSHAWNAVEIDKTWHFIDSTWGAGNINQEKAFAQEFTNFYFLCPESVFFYSHYPEEEIWLPDVWNNKSPSLGPENWSELLKFSPEFINLGSSCQNFTQ